MSGMRVDAKVVMLGKESVGKTSLVERYVHHRFLVGPYQNVRFNARTPFEILLQICTQNMRKKSWIFDTHTKKWHYTNNLYNITQTIGAAFVAKPIQVGGKVITLGIWVSQVPPLSPSRLPNNLEPSRCFI